MTPTPTLLEDLAACAAQRAGSQDLFTAYALLRFAREGRTAKGSRFVDLELADQSGCLAGKIWDDQSAAIDAALELPSGQPIKAMFQIGSYQGATQLSIKGIRGITDQDEGSYRPEAIYGEGIHLVEDLLCETLVFDIETVPAHAPDGLPETVSGSLTKFSNRRDMEPDAVMGMSPFFGKVVSLALGEGESDPAEQKVTALVVLPDGMDAAACPSWMRPMSEPDLLRAFWALAGAARTVVTYNGRGFDVPFLVHRSLVHGIPARIDLLSNRYALRPHLDLLQVVQQGTYPSGPTNLDVVCWAFGIESPKGQMDGSMVAPAYADGKIEEIAEYNLADVRATTEVYHKLRDGILRYRKDW